MIVSARGHTICTPTFHVNEERKTQEQLRKIKRRCPGTQWLGSLKARDAAVKVVSVE